MKYLITHPGRIYAILAALAVVGLATSFADGSAPKDGSPRPHDAGYNIAGVGWSAFLLAILGAIVFTVVVLLRRRRTTAA